MTKHMPRFSSRSSDRAISHRQSRDLEREPTAFRAMRHDYSRRRAQLCRFADIMCGAIVEPEDVEAASDEERDGEVSP